MNTHQIEIIDRIIGTMEFSRAEMVELLNPQPVRTETTFQLESALKELTASIGLLRGVKVQWEET